MSATSTFYIVSVKRSVVFSEFFFKGLYQPSYQNFENVRSFVQGFSVRSLPMPVAQQKNWVGGPALSISLRMFNFSHLLQAFLSVGHTKTLDFRVSFNHRRLVLSSHTGRDCYCSGQLFRLSRQIRHTMTISRMCSQLYRPLMFVVQVKTRHRAAKRYAPADGSSTGISIVQPPSECF